MTSPHALRRIKNLIWLQVFMGTLFAILGGCLPVYVFIEYGLFAHAVYDRAGNVIGNTSYFALGLGIGLFTLAMATWVTALALRALKDIQKRLNEADRKSGATR